MPERPPQPVRDEGESPQYDHARRRKSQRHGREKGCWVYIPADELAKAGFVDGDPPPLYRIWGYRRGSMTLRLYRPDDPDDAS